MNEVCEVIKKSINIIENEGWTRQEYYSLEDHGYCAVGAIYKAAGYRDFGDGYGGLTGSQESRYLVEKVLDTIAPKIQVPLNPNPTFTPWDTVTHFNDYKATDKDDIINLFKSALENCND